MIADFEKPLKRGKNSGVKGCGRQMSRKNSTKTNGKKIIKQSLDEAILARLN